MSALAFIPLVLVSASAAPITIHWDPELASDIKRGGYDVAVAGALGNAASLVVATLGMPIERPIDAMIYAPASYERAFGAAAAARRWAHYSGQKIHINGGIAIDGGFTGLLVHELTHAALDSNRYGGRIPTWMNEGLARLLEYEALGRGTVDDVQRLFLKDAQRNHDIVGLMAIKPPLDANGYLESFAAVSLLMQKRGRNEVLTFYRSVAEGTSPDDAWRALGTDAASFAKVFDAWVADYRG